MIKTAKATNQHGVAFKLFSNKNFARGNEREREREREIDVQIRSLSSIL